MNEIARTAPATEAIHAEYGALDRFLRQRLIDRMAGLRDGRLTLHDALGTVVLGEHAEEMPAQASIELDVRIDVDSPGFYRAIAGNGSVGAGEAWMDGHWRCSDLVALVRLLVRNRDLLDGMETGAARLGGLAMRAWHALRRNTRDGSRRNIAAHYDLGNDFFRLFLSTRPDVLLRASGRATRTTWKMHPRASSMRICRKLDLKPGDHRHRDRHRLGRLRGACGEALRLPRHHDDDLEANSTRSPAQRVARGRPRRIAWTLLLQDYRDLRRASTTSWCRSR